MKLNLFIKLLFAISIFVAGNYSYSAEEKSDLRTMFADNKAIVYVVNIRTFNADDKNENGIIDFLDGETAGSFINAVERLDELKLLGINTIHLLPITPTGKIKALGTAGSLYSLSDFRSLNLQLSDPLSEKSLKDQARFFINECHKRGIKVIVDLPSCGSYDLFINRPELFVTDKDGSPIIPADWTDVRLFNVPDTKDELLKSDIFHLHKLFINYMTEIGVDGIRADVATIKPYIFWKELISYARSKNPDLFFLAEASQSWTKPASEYAYFTDYRRLLEAGFDGWYGNFFELKNWKTADKLYASVKHNEKIIKKYSDKKSVIGSFATHDEVSPFLTGGENFAKIIIWLNATLPLNPYFVDGFLQGDDYIYDYSNKKAGESFTDDDYYYVHQGQIDIFNFSRKPGSGADQFFDEQINASNFRNKYLNQITKGSFIPVSTNNPEIFAFKRVADKISVYVFINRNLVTSQQVKFHAYASKRSIVEFIKNSQNIDLSHSMHNITMKPAEILIFTIKK